MAVLVGCFSVALVGIVGFGFASAGGAVADYNLFGSSSEAELGIESVSDTSSSASLTQTAYRDISQAIEAIEAEAAVEEAEHIAEVEAAIAEYQAEAASESVWSTTSTLSDVDWSVGEEAFVAEWTERINAYLEGSVLAGWGSVFAQAAWDYGVDPSWSPAIANTESGKGADCFEQYNAWGWTDSTVWSSWYEAIYAHVRGLANGYGYSITMAAAEKYCPPNYETWYYNTISAMKSI